MTIQCSCGEVLKFKTYAKAWDWTIKHAKHKEGILIEPFEEYKIDSITLTDSQKLKEYIDKRFENQLRIHWHWLNHHPDYKEVFKLFKAISDKAFEKHLGDGK